MTPDITETLASSYHRPYDSYESLYRHWMHLLRACWNFTPALPAAELHLKLLRGNKCILHCETTANCIGRCACLRLSFRWYSLRLPTKKWPGWVDLGVWSYSSTQTVTYPAGTNGAARRATMRWADTTC